MTARRFLILCGVVALAGLAATAAGIVLDYTATIRAVHPAALFWLAVSAGALPVMMTHRLTGGRWGDATERFSRAVAAPLPFCILVYVLLMIFGMSDLFEWTKPLATLPEAVRNKHPYLNIPFFIVRSAILFAGWLFLGFLFGIWDERKDERNPGLAAAAILVWVFVTTVFSIDWLMSLEPRWYSDIFGMLTCLSFVVPAMAAVVFLAAFFRVERNALFDFASLWLAAILGWAFLAFAQYLIIWMGNMPDEIGWFLHRSAGGWRVVNWLYILLLMLVPFIALLSGAVKRNCRDLMALSLLVLAGHALHMLWLVIPTFHSHGFFLPWQSVAAWLGMGGVWLGIVLLRLLPKEEMEKDGTIYAEESRV